jgi:hypothetical protein
VEEYDIRVLLNSYNLNESKAKLYITNDYIRIDGQAVNSKHIIVKYILIILSIVLFLLLLGGSILFSLKLRDVFRSINQLPEATDIVGKMIKSPAIGMEFIGIISFIVLGLIISVYVTNYAYWRAIKLISIYKTINLLMESIKIDKVLFYKLNFLSKCFEQPLLEELANEKNLKSGSIRFIEINKSDGTESKDKEIIIESNDIMGFYKSIRKLLSI